jgi:tetratricopeptide (TPR) repeat protein
MIREIRNVHQKMNFQSVARVTCLSAWAWMAAAAPDTSREAALPVPEKPLAALIQDLADDKFRVRENATREIWKIGESALEALQETATGKDPEQAYRAAELIRKIQLHITPDTDPAVIALVERYAKATPNEKMVLFDQMHKRRAWRQILKLYAAETNPDTQVRLLRSVEGVAVVAARECLLAGDVNGAREFLEMAPADAEGLLALADFHRSQGTWQEEMKRAKTLKGVQAHAWQLALHRAAGSLEAARDAADVAGEIRISAAMSALLGDPLPWLRKDESGGDGDGGATLGPYTEIAIQRWLGKEMRPADLEPLVRQANSKNREERQSTVDSLFLLGEPALAEKAYVANSRLSAFTYFESLERIPEALKTLGLDPENPDYAGWAAARFKHLTENGGGDVQDVTVESQQLILLGNFLERRGLNQAWADAFLKPLAALAEKDAKVFTEFLSQLFGGNATMSSEVLGAPLVAKQAAVAWAGDHAERWEEIVASALGGQDEVNDLWDWLSELKPEASRAERFDGLLALCGLGRDPLRLREKWLALAWEAINRTPQEKRGPLLEKLKFILNQSPDVINDLKLSDQVLASSRHEISWRDHILDLSAAGRWDAAAGFFQKQIDRISAARLDPEPSLHACLAACLRKAGRADEAAAQDSLVEKLALGNDAIEIANGYAYGSDYKRAADWWARAARQADPGSERFSVALHLHGLTLMEQGSWKEVAAVSEVRAQMMAAGDSGGALPLTSLRLRLQADLGRALANLKNDRAKSIAILKNCHGLFPSDGSLADDFFPSIRKMGLIKEHDEWFRISWARMTAVLERFPDSDNTCNTAAWLASRARRNLDQAEAYEKHALALNPEQSAYLDTMAEIQFAKGNRDKAIEWSTRAINFLPGDSMLRRQHERFRTAPLPR